MNEQFDELVMILSIATESAPADMIELLYGDTGAATAAERISAAL